MRYRWGKGKKDQNKLPNGEKIVFVKVGGRTSAVVPSVQKKTGPVAGDVKVENGEESGADGDGNATGNEHKEEPKPTKKGRGKKKQETINAEAKETGEENGLEESGKEAGVEPEKEQPKSAKKQRPAKKRKAADDEVASDAGETEPLPKKSKGAKKVEAKEPTVGRRRSGRTSAKG